MCVILAARSLGEGKTLKAVEQSHEPLGMEKIQGKGFLTLDDPEPQLYSSLAGVLGESLSSPQLHYLGL